MDFYLFSLLLGFAGLLIMAVSGVAGHGGDHAGHGHGHGGDLHAGHHAGDVNVHGIGGHGHAGHLDVGAHGHAGHLDAGHGHALGHDLAHGHGHGHAGADGHAHADHGDHGHHHGEHGDGRAIGSWFLSFLSPRVLFSVLIGIGAGGILLGAVLPDPLRLAAAIAAGFAFELLAVRPVWNFFFRFGSEPALTLESAITDTATAVTGFNQAGEGVVKIELDGQIVQVLARLSPADRATGTRVHAGDTLVVEEVDAARNSCTVSLPAAAGLIRGA